MATADADLRIVFTRDIIYEVFRRSVWANVFNQSWASESMMAWLVRFSEFLNTDEVKTEEVANRTALETGPTFTTTVLDTTDATPFYLRGYAQLNKADLKQTGTGPVFQQRLIEVLSRKLAIELDDKLAAVITGGTYEAIGTGNSNLIPHLGDDTDFVDRDFPHRASTTDALDYVQSAMRDAELLLVQKNVLDGERVGPGAVGPISAMMNPALAAVLVDYLKEEGLIDLPMSAGRQALASSGVLGNTRYMGTVNNINIMATNSLAVPGTGADWDMYFIPTGSAAAAGIEVPEVDDAQYGEGNTGGAYVFRRTVVQKAWGKILRQAHIIKATIDAGA